MRTHAIEGDEFLDALFSVPGQRWVAISSECRIVSAGESKSQVAEAAERAGVTAPVLAWIKVFGRGEAAGMA